MTGVTTSCVLGLAKATVVQTPDDITASGLLKVFSHGYTAKKAALTMVGSGPYNESLRQAVRSALGMTVPRAHLEDF